VAIHKQQEDLRCIPDAHTRPTMSLNATFQDVRLLRKKKKKKNVSQEHRAIDGMP
jgi:hypothetical protein